MKSDDYYDDDDDDESERRWVKTAGVGLVVIALAAGAFLLFSRDDTKNPQIGADSSVTEVSDATPSTSTAGSPADASTASTSSAKATDVTSTSDASDATDTTDAVASAGPAPSTTTRSTATTDGSGVETTTSSAVGAATPAAPGGPAQSTTTIPSGVDPVLGYHTSPDGSPLPALAVFDIDTVTLTGYVPSQAAKDRLAVLAKANSLTDAAVVNNLIVDEKVPANVGVRVIELNSPRFPAASAEIRPEHAAQLDRVANVMKALPNVSVLVIGHADQRGTEAANFKISDERAAAVVQYFIFLGISPTRLSSRAAGDSDLLTIADDETALALNRRTEFIIYGLLIP